MEQHPTCTCVCTNVDAVNVYIYVQQSSWTENDIKLVLVVVVIVHVSILHHQLVNYVRQLNKNIYDESHGINISFSSVHIMEIL